MRLYRRNKAVIGGIEKNISDILYKFLADKAGEITDMEYHNIVEFIINKANRYSDRQYEVIDVTRTKNVMEQKYFDAGTYISSIKRRKHSYDPLTDDEFMAIWKLHKRDYSAQNISNIFEISRNTVTKVLRNEEKYNALKKKELWQDDETLQKLKAHGFVE